MYAYPREEHPFDDDNDCVVYQVNFSSGYVGVMFITDIEGARKICDLPQTSGTSRGGHWMLCWDTLRDFIKHGANNAVKVLKDDGRYDKYFIEKGIKWRANDDAERWFVGKGWKIKH